jgi:hypothetical protein
MLQAGSVYPLKRFALKVLFLLAFGALQWRSGILRSLALLFLISGNLSVWLAVMSRSKLFLERRFTYWDEGVAFLTLSVLAALGART